MGVDDGRIPVGMGGTEVAVAVAAAMRRRFHSFSYTFYPGLHVFDARFQ